MWCQHWQFLVFMYMIKMCTQIYDTIKSTKLSSRYYAHPLSCLLCLGNCMELYVLSPQSKRLKWNYNHELNMKVLTYNWSFFSFVWSCIASKWLCQFIVNCRSPVQEIIQMNHNNLTGYRRSENVLSGFNMKRRRAVAIFDNAHVKTLFALLSLGDSPRKSQ